ncbi:MAG: hypothetical protein WCX32_04490 [Clostridia bacterium]|jgi:hypothetical protein|nr:hypothetical protein [Clostridia bacterium]MDD4276031.1 hypothetical protein [Clostridia bacterium]
MEDMETSSQTEEVKVQKAVASKPKKNFFVDAKNWIVKKVSNQVFMAVFLTLLSLGLLIIEGSLLHFVNLGNVGSGLFFIFIALLSFGGFFYSFNNKLKGNKNMDFLLALNVVILLVLF